MVNNIWFTGLPASGKTTLAKELQKKFSEWFLPYFVLDADEFRSIITTDLGFSKEDRKKNLDKAISVVKYINSQGFGVIASFITPFEESRRKIKKEINPFLIYLNPPLSTCKSRDPKGLYTKALNGEIKNFTGVNHPFEVPINPDLILDTEKTTVGECIDCIMKILTLKNRI